MRFSLWLLLLLNVCDSSFFEQKFYFVHITLHIHTNVEGVNKYSFNEQASKMLAKS